MHKILVTLLATLIINQVGIDRANYWAEKFDLGGLVQTVCEEIPTAPPTILISADTTLPSNPLNYEAFKQVMDYMAANNLYEITIDYSIPYKEEYHDNIKDILLDIVRKYCYEKPEYFRYFQQTNFSIVHRGNEFKLYIKSYTDGYEADQLLSYREDAFNIAAGVYKELYLSGKLKQSMTEQQRAEVILNWICKNTKYENDQTALCHTAWSVFSKGIGVCDGYSGALLTLLKLDGITCYGQRGHDNNGVPHHWIVAELDGVTTYIDPTFYDALANSKYKDDQFTSNMEAFAAYHEWA